MDELLRRLQVLLARVEFDDPNLIEEVHQLNADISDIFAKVDQTTELATDVISDFCIAWEDLEETGACDSIGGMQFSRILAEWLCGPKSENLEDFIRREANGGPNENP